MADAVKGNSSGPAVVFTAIRGNYGTPGIAGGMQGICLGDATGLFGDSTAGRHLQTGVFRNNVDGDPAAPCLELRHIGFWRFRWSVKAGVRNIQINAKQVSNYPTRPSMVLKAETSVGLLSDITAVAPSSTGWVVIGPATFTATAAGVVWVELHNNCPNEVLCPALFDHIVTT